MTHAGTARQCEALRRELANGGTIVRMGGYQGARSVHTRAGHILGREFLERAGDGHRLRLLRGRDRRSAGRRSTSSTWSKATSSISAISPRAIWRIGCPISRSSTCRSRSRPRGHLSAGSTARSDGGSPRSIARKYRLRAARLLGQRLSPFLQPPAPDPPARRIATACRSGR